MVIGIERDVTGSNSNISKVRVLKNRFCGETGHACNIAYDQQTTELTETMFIEEEEANDF